MAAFNEQEYRQRLARVRTRMRDKGFSVLLCPSPDNMNYLTGYDGWSFYLHQCVVIGLDRENPLWFGRSTDINVAQSTPVLTSGDVYPYPDDYIQSTTHHPYDFVAKVLHDAGWSKAVVGIDMDSYYFSPAALDALQRNLPHASFVDAGHLVNWLRVLKSPAEIECMRRAASIAVASMNAGVATISTASRKCDTAAAILHAQARGAQEFGGEYTAIAPFILNGEGTATPHITWSDERYVQAKSVVIEIAGSYCRYHYPLARTIFLGHPPQERLEAMQAIITGLGEALKAAVPGSLCEEIEAAWRSEIKRHGFEKRGRIGYSVGLGYPPDWGEHTLSIRPGDRTVLESGMTIFLIPALWGEKWSIGIGETFHITDDGAIRFTDIPFDIIVKN